MGLRPTKVQTAQITPSVSAGTGLRRKRPLADAWGYLAAPSDRMRNRFSSVQPPFRRLPARLCCEAETKAALKGGPTREVIESAREANCVYNGRMLGLAFVRLAG